MAIRIVMNLTDHPINFINSESSRDNRRIPSFGVADVGGAWVPWCTREAEFIAHHFEIVNADTGAVLWYIWQQDIRNADGDQIRCSSKGFLDNPSITGDSGTAGDRHLVVSPNVVRAAHT